MAIAQVFELTAPSPEALEQEPDRSIFEEDMAWLQAQGVTVERYNLAEHLGLFAATGPVKKALEQEREACLPMLLIDGRVAASGAYPERETLADLLDLELPEEMPSLMNEAVAELIALGAAMAASSERAFRVHVERARRLGVRKGDLIEAVNIGLTVKALPHQTLMDLAQQTLVGRSGSCCGGSCGCEDGECSEEGCGEGGCGCS